MEKEEKIKERERIAEEMSLFGRLRQFYPAFALFYVSVLRLIFWFIFSMPTRAASLIFVTQCLTIVNTPVTLVAALTTQTLI